jgi:putative flippase GtrA
LHRYLVMITCGFLINAAVMYAGVQWLALHYLVTQALAMIAVVLWNFVLSNAWVFKRR